jgi:hypothetical protein
MIRQQNLIVVLSVLVLVAANAPVRAADLPSTLMDPYLRIHVSLADDKMDGVAASANALSQEAQKLGVKAKTVATTAAKLATAKDIINARHDFGELSDAMMAYAKATGATFGPDVNVAVCPMVQKPWLQKGQKITNPYFGKSMLTCGEIKKG